jgi:superoxide dismutase, Cu-Zn family
MKAFLKNIPAFLFLSGMIALSGCQEAGEPNEMGADTLADDTAMQGMPMDQQQTATVQLEPTEGNTVQGTIRFVSMNGEIEAAGSVSGLQPGEHGIHIHQNGDCSNNAEAAGPHWSGQGAQHGAPDDPMQERHAGDLGNLEADDTGSADFEQTVELMMPLDSLAGKALIIHAGQDDLETQPSGDSGARVACGVIEMAAGSGMDMDADTAGMGADTTGL